MFDLMACSSMQVQQVMFEYYLNFVSAFKYAFYFYIEAIQFCISV